jgi:hypothetical protein
MNSVGALLLGGAARVLRTARAVLSAGAEDATPRADDEAAACAAVDYCFECALA